MEFFITIYHTVLYQPILNILVWLAQHIPGHDFGVAVILLTILTRVVSYPLGAKALRAQKKFSELQPKMKEIQEKFKGKREEQAKAMSEFFREAKINPFASFAPFLIQIPIFIVLYQLFAKGFNEEQFSFLYSFVQAPEQIQTSFLGLVDLNERFFGIALVAGVLQFLQLRQMQPAKKDKPAKEGKSAKQGKPDIGSLMQKQMMYILPVLIVWIASSLPSAFGLYIATTTVFSMWQHWFISRGEKKEA